ncbi:diguanylate cyclase/phosphodiesterase (GGDEF & EAL domains) with PAS/PAC sensor(s) [hydrothermal vent metagenome]|uniref:Diguanylate cyclase/phosphodiesterase (GGDEF & EAL domains) with PAS/PAC sensor(S) n=1 Tax=hydrothermal vent metagenome TaxID=652676 RepID=A0A3B0ZET8_9ZZZZ
MDLSLFQKLTESELDNYLNEIDLVVEFHIKWLSELNRALVCHTVIERQQIQNILSTDEHFTRWHQGIHDEELIKMPAFKVLGVIHTEMLKLASSLLAHAGRGEQICVDEYDRFTLLTHELRSQIAELKNKIKVNLQLVAKLMGKVFENAKEGVMITDVDSYILNVNQAFVKVTQYTKEEVLGKKPSILHSGNHDKGFYERMWDVLLREKCWQGEVWNSRKNSEIYPEWLSITAVLDDNDDTTHYIGIFSDVSVRNEGDDRLYHLAHYDCLCDLPNRMLFYDRLRQSLSRSKRSNQKIAVMFMDLDGFKQVNDEYGHGVGDELLQQVSQRVTAVLRESDTLARIGGDEFTIIINDIDRAESIDAIATKILETIQESYFLHDVEFNISASLGISLFPDNSEDVNTLVKHADIAMYKAKQEGKNRFKYFNKSML